MKIKCLHRKNLKLSPEKLAAQVGHVVGNLVQQQITYSNPKAVIDKDTTIIVLKASNKKFEEKHDELVANKNFNWYLQRDAGYTEIPADTRTVIGWIEDE